MARSLPTRRGRAIAAAAAVLAVVTLAVAAFAIKDTVLEELYIRRLGSPRLEERRAAALKLGEMRSARAVPSLLKLIERVGQPAVDATSTDSSMLFYDVSDLLTGENHHAPEESSLLMKLLQDNAEPHEPLFQGSICLTVTPSAHARVIRVLEVLRIIRPAIEAIGVKAIPELSKVKGDGTENSLVRDLATVEFAALLRGMERQQQAASLLRLAGDPSLNHEFRNRALIALGELESLPDDAVPVLIKVLDDPDPVTRFHAADSLGKLGRRARAAIPALQSAANDEREYLRRAATAALAKIERP